MLWCGAARVLVRPRSIFARSLSSSASYVELPQAWAATYEASSQRLLVAYAPGPTTPTALASSATAPPRTAEVLSEKLRRRSARIVARARRSWTWARARGWGERLVEQATTRRACGHGPLPRHARGGAPEGVPSAAPLCDLEDEDAERGLHLRGSCGGGYLYANHASAKTSTPWCAPAGGCFSLRDDFQASPSNGQLP